MKISSHAVGMALALALVAGLMPTPARALGSGSDEDRPIRLSTTARFSPMGSIKLNQFGASDVAIDGRLATQGAEIWGGELIKVLSLRSVSIDFKSLGQVTLSQGASVRFAEGRESTNDSRHNVLIASLLEGAMNIALDPQTGAYVESAGRTFSAAPGAGFSIDVRSGRASLSTAKGDVSVQDQTPPQDVNIRIVDDLGRPVSSGSQLSVRARSTRQIQVQVTDKNDKPLPDLPVLFSLGDPCLGSLGLGAAAGGTFRQKTDKRGIAAVPLVAGAARCAASIVAKVEGTNASISIQTNVVQSKGFWNTQNTLIVVAVAAAAGIGIGLAVANSGSEPIRAVPPPQVKP